MKKAYDCERATRLVPLLEVISREIVERRHQVRLLERRIARFRANGRPATEILDCKAQLATHLRELRHANTELERLGCVVDDEHPSTIFIPGADGELDRGFRWNAIDGSIRRNMPDKSGVS